MSHILGNPYLPHYHTRGRKWYDGERDAYANFEGRDHRRFNKLWGTTTFATLNIHSLGSKREDVDFYFSYLESLGHDPLGATEMWNSQRHYESW